MLKVLTSYAHAQFNNHRNYLLKLMLMLNSIIIVITCLNKNKITDEWSYQEYNHHEAVEDGEPMDAMLEEVRIQVLIKSVLKDVKVKIVFSL